jgi:hypothetical protein
LEEQNLDVYFLDCVVFVDLSGFDEVLEESVIIYERESL